MNKNCKNIKELHENKQLTSFSAKEDSVEDLIYEFLKDRGEATERAYQKDLKHFFEFTGRSFGLPRIEGNKMLFEEIRRVHIVKYKKYLESTPSSRKKPFAPNTINRKLSAVSSILLLFTTGMRQAELRNLTLSNFSTIEGIRFMNYVGKGNKMNRVPIHPTTAFYLDEYLGWMAKIGRPIKDRDYFFQPTKNSHGGRLAKKLSHTALGYIVSRWAKRVNSEKRN